MKETGPCHVPHHTKLHEKSCCAYIGYVGLRYRCMNLRKLYTIDDQDGNRCKYFGKWPFQRVLGVQELLSVVFSLANLAAHAHNMHKIRTAQLINQHRPNFGSSQGLVWGLWYTYALGSINAWWWSAVFHSRDTHVTERLDYLSADVSIVIGLYVSIVRVLGVTSLQSRLTWAVPLAFATVIHFYYMLFIKFDYGFNVTLCVSVGVLQQVMWCTWALMNSHPCKRQLVAFVVLINATLSLEILDFPPIIGFLDAHALWHLCTVPLIYLWYCFILADAKWATASAAHLTPADKQQ